MVVLAENHEIIDIYYIVWYKPVGLVRQLIGGLSDIGNVYAWILFNFVYSRSEIQIFSWTLLFLNAYILFHAFNIIRFINLIKYMLCLICVPSNDCC